MTKKRSLEALQNVASGRETRWQRQVSAQFRALQTEQQRLQQLHSFVAEYGKQIDQPGSSQSIQAMRSQRQFVTKLRSAVGQQSETVARQQAATDRDVDHWRLARAQRQAIEKYSERQELAANRRRDRRAQLYLDEVGRNAFLARRK